MSQTSGHDLVQRVEPAPGEAPSRQGDVDGGGRSPAGRGLQGAQGFIQGCLQGLFGPVGFLADLPPHLRVQVSRDSAGCRSGPLCGPNI